MALYLNNNLDYYLLVFKMNMIPNPTFLSLFTKHSLSVDRLWDMNSEKLRKYQTKSLKKIIEYAKDTSLYQKKFKKSKIDVDAINDISDINKIPFTTKQDLRDYGIKGTLPSTFDVKKGYKVDTSGSTGKPVSIYRDINAIALEMTTTSRMMLSHGLSSVKTRISNVGDFSLANSYDEECITKGVTEQMGLLGPLYKSRIQNLFTGKEISKIMQDLEEFRPDIFIAYPGTLIGLMQLKNEGFGENLNPSHIVYSGGVLDPYSKKQIENAFDAHVFGLYTGTESGVIAFQCPYGNYHVQSDLVHIDAVDSKGKSVSSGEHGHIVITRLYGGGTPIIRYTGMDDIITPLDGECECGMHSPLIKNVEGRKADSIVLPDGRIFPAATFTLIPGEVAQEIGVDIIHRFQIIQHKKDHLELLIVINKDKRKSVKSVKKILNEIKNRYKKLVGKEVQVDIKEVDKVKEDKRTPLNLSSIVISHVDHKDWF